MLDTLLVFRRSGTSGRLCAFGPVSLLKVGSVIRVHHADGSVLKTVGSVSRSVMRCGVPCAYAHIETVSDPAARINDPRTLTHRA